MEWMGFQAIRYCGPEHTALIGWTVSDQDLGAILRDLKEPIRKESFPFKNSRI